MERGVVQRLTYLHGAGGVGHRRRIQVKIETGRLEGQLQVLEKTPRRRFLCADDVLVGDIQNSARQHPVPVLHEPSVADVEVAQFVQVVGEGEARFEAGFVNCIASGQRVARQVDDVRAGKRTQYQRAVEEIGRLLVGKAWFIAALRLRQRQIFAG